MATFTASDLLTKSVPGIDQAIAVFGTITPAALLTTADKAQPLKMPAGFRVGALLINVRVLGFTTIIANIGFSHTDGSTPPVAVFPTPATQIATGDISLQTVGTKIVMPQAGPWVTVKESYLELVPTTSSTVNTTGVVDFMLMGEFVGTK
jgi:hypothetical protein